MGRLGLYSAYRVSLSTMFASAPDGIQEAILYFQSQPIDKQAGT